MKDCSNIIIEKPLSKRTFIYDERSEHWIYNTESYEFYVSSCFDTFIIYDKKLDKHFPGSLIRDDEFDELIIGSTCAIELPKDFCSMLVDLGFKISPTIHN